MSWCLLRMNSLRASRMSSLLVEYPSASLSASSWLRRVRGSFTETTAGEKTASDPDLLGRYSSDILIHSRGFNTPRVGSNCPSEIKGLSECLANGSEQAARELIAEGRSSLITTHKHSFIWIRREGRCMEIDNHRCSFTHQAKESSESEEGRPII